MTGCQSKIALARRRVRSTRALEPSVSNSASPRGCSHLFSNLKLFQIVLGVN